MIILKRLFPIVGIAIAILIFLLICLRYDRSIEQLSRALKSQPTIAIEVKISTLEKLPLATCYLLLATYEPLTFELSSSMFLRL